MANVNSDKEDVDGKGDTDNNLYNNCFGAISENGIIIGSDFDDKISDDNNNDSNNNTWVCSIPNSIVSLTIT